MTNQISTTYLKKHLLLNIGGAYHLSLIAIVLESLMCIMITLTTTDYFARAFIDCTLLEALPAVETVTLSIASFD